MQTWMEGYESDIEYTAGYYREQEPHLLSLCAAINGVQTIDLEKPFTYIDLGCGYGMTSLILAANYPQGQFFAVDFNPTHIAKARYLAAKAGLSNITFLENSFADLVENPSLLPACDFIALHGIFTWVNDENRQHIIKVCERHLKSGGLVYNSYNAMPGWVIGEPIQKLLMSSSQQFSGSSMERFDQAVNLLKQLVELNPYLFKTNYENTKKRLDALSSKDRHYLVHEYLHEGWKAFYFTEIAHWMRSAKLEFVGAASPSDVLSRRQFSSKVTTLLDQIKNPDTRELYLDMIRNTVFRRDIFSRGVIQHLDNTARLRWFDNTQWMARAPARFDDSAFNFTPALNKDVYRRIIDRLASGVCSFKSLSEGDLERETMQALLQLYNANQVSPYYPHADITAVQRFNLALVEDEQTTIALPHARGHVRLKPFDAHFYSAALRLKTQDINALSQQVYRDLEVKKLNINQNGQILKGEAMLNHLQSLANKWHSQLLPILTQGGAL